MNKKTIFAIILIIIGVILIVGIYTHPHLINNDIKVGATYFTPPEGYNETTPNKDGDITITNGTNSISLAQWNDTLDESINSYITIIKDKNITFEQKNIEIDNLVIYKVTVNNNTMRYWFSFNNHTYTIYSWDGNNNLDMTVIDLIKSAHK